MCAQNDVHAEVREQLVGIGSPFIMEVQGLNSEHQASWWQAPFPAELSLQTRSCYAVQAGLKLAVVLLCCNCRCMLQHYLLGEEYLTV